MSPSACLICSSPTASSLHFGARSCKACAAFFRRTVSMSMKYACAAQAPSERPCNIHYHLRMICRHCRYLKCMKAGMKRELVQRRSERVAATPRVTASPPEGRDEPRPASKGRSDECSTPLPLENVWEAKEEEEDEWSQASTSTSSPHQTSQNNSESPQTSCCGSFLSSREHVVSCEDIERVTRHYIRREKTHWERIRILFTDIRVQQLFDVELPDCPYNRQQLRPMKLAEFRGMGKDCLLACYDHTLGLCGVEQLKNKSDKNLLYRYVVMVDYAMASAFISSRVGKEEGLLVMTDGTFLSMRPLPAEEKARGVTPEEKKEIELYRTLMPLHIRHFVHVVDPFIALDLSFNEYTLLKAISTWQLAHFRVSAECRALCEQQRNLLVAALHDAAIERGFTGEAAPVRVGNLLLFLANVMEFTLGDLSSTFFKITYFDLHEIDPLIRTMCSHVY